jgi:Sulfotransferase domain
MRREWYVIIGLAKTGTTVIATTLQNTLRIPDFCMEPQTSAKISQFADRERLVIKIIFEHWSTRLDELKAVLRGQPGGDAPTVIVILRDPRDELVSRLHYSAYNYFSTRPTTLDDRIAWIEIFRLKEAAPNAIALLDMEEQIKSKFGQGFCPAQSLYETYSQFVDELIVSGAPGMHLVRYEDFIHDTISDEVLRAMLSARRDVGARLRRVHRTGSSGAWNYFLTPRDVAFYNIRFEPILTRFNYPLEPAITTERPSAATGSDYVAGLIDEARAVFANRSVPRQQP